VHKALSLGQNQLSQEVDHLPLNTAEFQMQGTIPQLPHIPSWHDV